MRCMRGACVLSRLEEEWDDVFRNDVFRNVDADVITKGVECGMVERVKRGVLERVWIGCESECG